MEMSRFLLTFLFCISSLEGRRYLSSSAQVPKTTEKIQKNLQLATIDEWGPLFQISFDLIIHSKVDSTWSSVLAFRGNGAVDDWSHYGDRAPAIFYNKAGYLHFTNAVNGNRNYHVNYNIELNKLYQIEIAQEEKNGKVFYTVKVDGVTIKSVENTDARSFKDVKVFAGDNFFPPTDGRYSNLIWESFKRGGDWVKVFSHDVTGGLFKSDEEALNKNADDPSAKLFSRLDQLEKFRREDGKFHFKIVYPLLGGSNEWIQTSNLATSNTIEGYEAVNIDYKVQGHSKPWEGLGLCTGQRNAFICDTPTTGYWWMCVGCQSTFKYPDTIPGPLLDPYPYTNGLVTQVELYVQPTGTACADGWSQFGGRCYKFVKEKKVWNEARDDCLSQQADLASVHSSEENQFVTDLSDGRRFWLGGKVGWSWSDGTPWDYQNWFPGEPSGDGECLENFASINQHDNQSTWNDRGCTNIGDVHGDLGYVCKRFNQECPSGWSFFQGRCYLYVTTLRNWENARRYCIDQEADLVSIHSKEENEFLGKLHDSKVTPGVLSWFWVGARRDENNLDTFLWTDGSVMDYESWGENEPNNQNGREHCALSGWGTGTNWNDGTCNSAGYSVCEK